MTKKDKKLLSSMITALEKFEECQVKFSELSWYELCQKINEGEWSPPTWNEISDVKERLQIIKDGIN